MTEKKLSADIREYVARHGLSNGNEDEYAAWGWADRAAALEAEVAELRTADVESTKIVRDAVSRADAYWHRLGLVEQCTTERDVLAAQVAGLKADVENQKCLAAIAEGNLEGGRAENTALRARIAEAVKVCRIETTWPGDSSADLLAILAPESEGES